MKSQNQESWTIARNYEETKFFSIYFFPNRVWFSDNTTHILVEKEERRKKFLFAKLEI